MTIWAIALWLFSAGTSPQARVERLERSLLAPCCFKESIWRHRSDISTKMKLEVAGWVAAGKSDEEILAVYRERYGARVVVPPEPDPSPWVRIVPWLAALGGAVLVVRVLARWRSEGAEAAGSPLS
ncbi:MAG TPA: cytochrome c-type biogenesis protein CcmH [Bryobacteraceae bacterium]|nr:cytochrome c-type biogenesis protein CcmH [Bryobacteraceae bacterium]